MRDQEFAKSLADLAKKAQFIVELSGGVLSHAYYMLASSGCAVECVDLDEYATEDEEVEFNKLVRDRIPDNIIARGENVAVYRLDGEALIAALRHKLIEEAFEVVDAQNTIQIAEELADLREVEAAIMSRLGITDQSIETIRKKKIAKRGAFEHALMLSRTALSPSLSVGDGEKNSLTAIRSGSICLNSFPRFISGLWADCGRCRVVQGGVRRLRRTQSRGGQLGVHRGLHLKRPASCAARRPGTSHAA